RYRAGERRLDQLFRRCRNDEEGKAVPVESAIEEIDERSNILAEADPASRFNQVLAPNHAEFRVVTDQVRQLSALLNEIARAEPVDFLAKVRDANQIAQDLSRIVEAERLIEIGCEEKVLRKYLRHRLDRSKTKATSTTKIHDVEHRRHDKHVGSVTAPIQECRVQ